MSRRVERLIISLPRYEDDAWERNGAIRIEDLILTDDLGWLRTTLHGLVEGKVDYDGFVPAWWEERTALVANKPSKASSMNNTSL